MLLCMPAMHEIDGSLDTETTDALLRHQGVEVATNNKQGNLIAMVSDVWPRLVAMEAEVKQRLQQEQEERDREAADGSIDGDL